MAYARSLLRTDRVGFDALIRHLNGVGHLFRGGAGEGSVETLDIDAAIPHLRVDCLVHGGEQFVAEFVEDLVDVEIRDKEFSVLRCSGLGIVLSALSSELLQFSVLGSQFLVKVVPS